MANGDLKVLCVHTQDNKQIGYKVEKSDGNVIRADRDQMLQAISYGHKFINATVSNSGVVRVDSSVPRENININKKPAKVLDYSGDITEFLKEGKTINPFEIWNSRTTIDILRNVSLIDTNKEDVILKTKYIPSGVVDKSINRNLYRTYIDPAKAYKKYTFNVSVAEAKKYGHPTKVPKIEKFIDEHKTNETTPYWVTDCFYTTWHSKDNFYGYDTITVWVYVANIIPNLGRASSMIYLSMINDILNSAQSRLYDCNLLHGLTIIDKDAISIDPAPYVLVDDTMIFYDERIYKKFVATAARYNKLNKQGACRGCR